MALARVLQGGLLGAALGMAVGYFAGGQKPQDSVPSFPFEIPDVEKSSEASYLCMELGEFRAYSNEAYSTICKHMNKILMFEAMVNDTTETIDAGIPKKAHKFLFETKEWLKKFDVPDPKRVEFTQLSTQIEKFLEEKKHNIDLGVSSRLGDEY